MRWVKEIFPPRPRCRWLLMTIRLSISNWAGTARTLVAVGTLRLAAMFSAVRAAAPRSLLRSASLGGGVAGEACAGGAGATAGLAAATGAVGVASGATGAPGASGVWVRDAPAPFWLPLARTGL